MDIFDAIATRRSVRKYTDRPVTDEDIRTVLEAAMMAPSAGNAQPWHFVVVRDAALRARVAELNVYAAMARTAPAGILVCGDLHLEKYPGFWVQDCSAAIQNLLLAAHGLGLGAVWTGIHPVAEREEGFRRAFGLPAEVVPLGYIVLGYPDQHPHSESRFREDRVHRDVW